MLRDLSMTSAEWAGFGVVFVEANVAGIVTCFAAAFCSAVATGARRFRLLQQFVVFFGG
jgi:hypothetical protein